MPEEYKLVLKHADEAGYTSDIQCYLKHGGYKTLKKAFRVKPKKAKGSVVSPQEAIRKEVLASGLRGRGGADLLEGGAGRDTASYTDSAAGVVVDLRSGNGSGGDAEVVLSDETISVPITAVASAMSSALPCGMPSAMSNRITSPSASRALIRRRSKCSWDGSLSRTWIAPRLTST